MARGAPILVVGSLNVDQTLRVPRIPGPGETLTAHAAMTSFGGKGANQAVAAARAGGQVRMIGCVGDDDHGRRYRDHLVAEGIDTAGIVTAGDEPTGSAFIAVDDSGENSILVHPGANHALTERHLEELAPLFEGVAVLLVQLECPLTVVRRAVEMARAAGAAVILNPSPWLEAAREGVVGADILIVNETEATALTGREPTARPEDPASLLAGSVCETLIVTRAGEPTWVISRDEGCFGITPPTVTPVDTVGAGDTFAGAFAVAHSEGVRLREAVGFANKAAALATQEPGAQSAIPRREAIHGFEGAAG